MDIKLEDIHQTKRDTRRVKWIKERREAQYKFLCSLTYFMINIRSNYPSSFNSTDRNTKSLRELET